MHKLRVSGKKSGAVTMLDERGDTGYVYASCMHICGVKQPGKNPSARNRHAPLPLDERPTYAYKVFCSAQAASKCVFPPALLLESGCYPGTHKKLVGFWLGFHSLDFHSPS